MYRRSYLVAFNKSFPGLDETFTNDIVIFRGSIRIVVQHIRNILIHIRDEHAQFRAKELIEQLLDPSLNKQYQQFYRQYLGKLLITTTHPECRPKPWHKVGERRDAVLHAFRFRVEEVL